MIHNKKEKTLKLNQPFQQEKNNYFINRLDKIVIIIDLYKEKIFQINIILMIEENLILTKKIFKIVMIIQVYFRRKEKINNNNIYYRNVKII